jgi:hypothetical protein
MVGATNYEHKHSAVGIEREVPGRMVSARDLDALGRGVAVLSVEPAAPPGTLQLWKVHEHDRMDV